MHRPVRIAIHIILSAYAFAVPGWAGIIVNWLDTPVILSTEWSTVFYALDLNNDSLFNLTFSASLASVAVRSENNSRLLVREPPPPNRPGAVVPLVYGHEISLDSAQDDLIWFSGHSDGPGTPGYETDFRTLGIWLSSGSSGEFLGQHAYIGVEFDIAGASHYGWINISVGEHSPWVAIYGWAYESTPGMPIMAGAIPEPSALSLIGIGALAILYKKKSIANNRPHPTPHKCGEGGP